MKRKIMVLVLMLLVSLNQVKALNYTNYLPGGKNFLDPNNLTLNGSTMSTIENFKVLDYTYYTLSMPGTDMLGEEIIVVIEGTEVYVNGNIADSPLCTVDYESAVCTFRTALIETDISVSISGSMIGMYYTAYQSDYFQLEEGDIPTAYEPYVAPFSDTTSPEVNGAGAYIMSYENTTDIQTIIDAHIIVYDEIDGDLSDQIMIESDEYSTNEGVVGEYEVLLFVMDSSNNTTNFILTIMVKDEIAPVIIGPDEIDVEVHDSRTTMELIQEHFDVSDGYDSNVLPVIVSDEYTNHSNQLGTYAITFEVIDSSLNRVEKTVSIQVSDTIKPSVSGDTTVTSYLSNPITLGEIMNNLSYSDNYSDMTNVLQVIIYDDFTDNSSNPGDYIVGLQVKDSSNNILSVTLNITVVDDVAPVITGPSEHEFSYTDPPSMDDILSMFMVSDNVDALGTGDLVIQVDTFTNRESDIGIFQIMYAVTDTSGNQTSHELLLSGVDDVPPVIYIDQYIITLDSNSSFTEQDALRLLLSNNELPLDDYEITTLSNEYLGNEKQKGTYGYSLQFKNTKGEVFEKDFQIRVQSETSDILDEDLVMRNVLIYLVVLAIIGFVYYKKR